MANTELVNFEALALEDDMSRRNDLARNVATLFSFTSETCSDEQIETYDHVLVRLADMVEAQARAFIADRLAILRRAPENTVRRLAQDEIVVARPLLERSTVLRDVDLIEIARDCGDDHRMAIATREILSELVTDVLVEEGGDPVKRAVAENAGASLSSSGVSRLLNAASIDEELQLALAERGDLQEAEISRLAELAGERVRIRLFEAAGSGAEALPAAAKAAAQRLSNDFWLQRYDFETAMGRVLALARGPGLGEQTLLRFAEQDRFAEVVATFAMLGDIGLEEAKHWMVRLDTDPFLIVAKACGLKASTVDTLLTIGPWRYRLPAAERARWSSATPASFRSRHGNCSTSGRVVWRADGRGRTPSSAGPGAGVPAFHGNLFGRPRSRLASMGAGVYCPLNITRCFDGFAGGVVQMARDCGSDFGSGCPSGRAVRRLFVLAFLALASLSGFTQKGHAQTDAPAAGPPAAAEASAPAAPSDGLSAGGDHRVLVFKVRDALGQALQSLDVLPQLTTPALLERSPDGTLDWVWKTAVVLVLAILAGTAVLRLVERWGRLRFLRFYDAATPERADRIAYLLSRAAIMAVALAGSRGGGGGDRARLRFLASAVARHRAGRAGGGCHLPVAAHRLAQCAGARRFRPADAAS
ncbi:MAG: DUF2336 domain-containing protein [Alphaproteobacteria bacterium]|nr:DUF2336 domain-containing protein [Alphaproteobacteria bacterium]